MNQSNIRFKNKPQHKKPAALDYSIAKWHTEIRPYFTAKSIEFSGVMCRTLTTCPDFISVMGQLVNCSWKWDKYWMLFKVGAEKMPVLWFGFRKLLQLFSVIQRLPFPSPLAIPFKMITEIGSDTGTAVLSQYEQNIACTWPIPLKPNREA